MRYVQILSTFVLATLATTPSWATCTSSPRQCIDTLAEVHVDSSGTVFVYPKLADQANLGCTLTFVGTDSTNNAIPLRRSNPSFDQELQILLVAVSSFLTVDINVSSVSGICEVADVSLRP